jgi:hypothetical protein
MTPRERRVVHREQTLIWVSPAYGFSMDTGMRPVSNVCSVQPGEAPNDEVDVHLGNPAK